MDFYVYDRTLVSNQLIQLVTTITLFMEKRKRFMVE